MRSRRLAPYWLSAPALLVYAAFLVVPMGAIALISFQHFEFYGGIQPGFTLKNYAEVFGDGYYWEIFGRTFWIALVVTAACAILGTFEAIVLNRMENPWKGLFLMIVLGPLLISVVVRTLGWALLFGSTGLVNKGLALLGIDPVQFMYANIGVIVALTHVLVPFVVISVWASLQRIDPAVERAAVSLGAGRAAVLRRVIVPLAMPGILSGSVIVFALAASAFATLNGPGSATDASASTPPGPITRKVLPSAPPRISTARQSAAGSPAAENVVVGISGRAASCLPRASSMLTTAAWA